MLSTAMPAFHAVPAQASVLFQLHRKPEVRTLGRPVRIFGRPVRTFGRPVRTFERPVRTLDDPERDL